MSIWLTNTVLEFRRRAGRGVVALLLAISTVFSSPVVIAEPRSAGSAISLKAFCDDPDAAFAKLQAVIKSRVGVLPTDTRYDEVVSGVLWRLVNDCLDGKISSGSVDHEARLNMYVRNERVDALRRNQRLEYQAEITDLMPPASDVAVEDILDVIQRKATTRQQMVFTMLAQGMTLQEIADHIGVAVGTVHDEKRKIATLLRTELSLPHAQNSSPAARRARAILAPEPTTRETTATNAVEPNVSEPSMTRIQSPLGAEIVAAIKSGVEVMPTGGSHAGPVMTIKVPRSQLSGNPVDGIVMLPIPVILKSDTAGEQDMIVAAAREIGDGHDNNRTFALYAFCKDEHLETPGDLSRYSFKSDVSDPKVVDIVTRSDLRRPEAISDRLWKHYAGG